MTAIDVLYCAKVVDGRRIMWTGSPFRIEKLEDDIQTHSEYASQKRMRFNGFTVIDDQLRVLFIGNETPTE